VCRRSIAPSNPRLSTSGVRNVSVVALYPWLLFTMVPVILVILAFNFLGDGLRDAADPYK
jgi:ABC-type dipeptide/oligopeptide/nickel transport system permease subunit